MNAKKILNKKVVKQTVGDLKEALKNIPDDREVVLSFMCYDKGKYAVYLADVFANMKYDPVIKQRIFDDTIVELTGFTDEYSTYMEKCDE